ncbi:flagellar biosynthesis protein [Cognatishimia sp. WU-CL00825]|uniref:hypothetical protein n=1 Tax=Cognatishimia sp. WU-CL00825 TaxID=3127658 RepID=UPI003108AD9F
MTIGHLLQEFQGPRAQVSDLSGAPNSAAYEDGFKAGWEDAMAANAQDKTALSATLASNLRDLAFTFFEARSATLENLDEMVDVMVAKALPEIARATLGLRLAQLLRGLSHQGEDAEIELCANAGDVAAIQAIMTDVPGVALGVVADPKLPEGCVQWRIQDQEHQLDIESLISEINTAVRGFLHEMKKEKRHA